MSYREEDRARWRRRFSKEAIALAMRGQWQEAAAANQGILDLFPNDVEALNRLGRARLELGEYAAAEAAYRRSTEIDPYNAIATRNLERLSRLGGARRASQAGAGGLEPQVFIEEVGKAGVVQLEEPAPAETLARMAAGDRVQLKIDGARMIVESGPGEYLGLVEAGHAQRLTRLAAGGNRYEAALVSATPEAASVIVREVYQDPSQVGRLSFPATGGAAARTDIGDRALRRELEEEEALTGETGYTVVGGGEETEILVEGSPGSDNDSGYGSGESEDEE
ncbi:MAG: tetratricopeptide repeat protein [Dehalococcoidales bacterium]